MVDTNSDSIRTTFLIYRGNSPSHATFHRATYDAEEAFMEHQYMKRDPYDTGYVKKLTKHRLVLMSDSDWKQMGFK